MIQQADAHALPAGNNRTHLHVRNSFTGTLMGARGCLAARGSCRVSGMAEAPETFLAAHVSAGYDRQSHDRARA